MEGECARLQTLSRTQEQGQFFQLNKNRVPSDWDIFYLRNTRSRTPGRSSEATYSAGCIDRLHLLREVLPYNGWGALYKALYVLIRHHTLGKCSYFPTASIACS